MQEILAFVGAALGWLTGLSSQEQVERLSQEDRDFLQVQFGSIDEWITQVDLVAAAGIPQGFDLTSIAAGLGIDTEGTLAVGQGATFNGHHGQIIEDNGQFFFQADQTGGDTTFRPIALDDDFRVVNPGTSSDGSLVADDAFSEADSLSGIFNQMLQNVPDFSSVLTDIDVSAAAVDPEEVLSLLNNDPTDIQGRLQSTFDDIFAQIGNLKTDFDFDDFLPDLLQDPDAFRQAELENLRDTELNNRANETLRASRGLQESGILPTSAAFGTETGLAPQIRSQDRTAEGQLNIEQDVQQIIGTNAGFEAAGRSQAAQINAQNVIAGTAGMTALAELSVEIGRIEEEGRLASNAIIVGVMNEAGRQALAAAGIEINANHLDIQNEFMRATMVMGITKDQINQFNAMLAMGANLTQAQMSMVSQLMLGKLQAEMAQTGSTVLNSDIYNSGLQAAGSVIQIFQMMQGPKGSNQSGQWMVFGTGGGGGGSSCIAKFCTVLTPNGAKTIEDVQIGDEVLSSDGVFRQVVVKDYGFIEEEDREDCYMVATDRGNVIVATEFHTVGGKPIGEWRVGEAIKVSNLYDGGAELTAVVTYNEIVPYVVSGDLLLEGNADYFVNGFVAKSVIGENTEAIMKHKVES